MPRKNGIDPDELDAYVRKLVAAAPPLSREQRDRLALIFREARTGDAPIAPVGGDALDEMLGGAK